MRKYFQPRDKKMKKPQIRIPMTSKIIAILDGMSGEATCKRDRLGNSVSKHGRLAEDGKREKPDADETGVSSK
jgi:hypothetical protein